ncbi:MAG: ATP-dependent DNA helicase UvrD2, partial [Microthrixaceae bacterium]|nr:ATP-dependent DNA helicase UvrD2 [Microthrixaceae bacterium]
ESHFPGSSTVILDRNYRSTPQILAVANAVLLEGGSTALVKLKAQRRDGPVPQVFTHDDAEAEARAIARAVRDRHSPGKAWSHQAVLVRTNAQAMLIVEEFKRSGIPHAVRGGGSLLTQPEIRAALNSLRSAPSLEMGLADIEDAVRSEASEFIRTQVDDQTGGTNKQGRVNDHSMNDERAANLMELVRLGHEYTELDPTGGIAGFPAWLTSTLQGDDRAVGDVVEIMSFHAAKGLEWPVVHLAGLEEGFVPIHHAKDQPASIEEERRLLYVAMTRARDELLCNWAMARTFGTRSVKRKPSRWVETITETVQVAAPVLSGEAGARRARETRRALRNSAERSSKQSGSGRKADGGRSRGSANASGSTRERVKALGDNQAIFEELRKWRKAQADSADVPAFVVFSDETLIELAQVRPKAKKDLLNIHGIGPVKAERYCDDILAIIAGYR